MLLRVFGFALVVASLSQPSLSQQVSSENPPIANPDARTFLPQRAVLNKELAVDFENRGVGEVVLAYFIPDQHDRARFDTGVRVLKYNALSSWTVVYEETGGVENGGGGSDAISIERVRSTSGKDGVVVIQQNSGAGTVTDWHVLASTGNGISELDPRQARAEVLNARGYADNGYNGVKVNGDLVAEDLTGYSLHAARCCPNRPSLLMSFKFTGSSLALDSVTELPYRLPKSGWHGPLLHLNERGLWAYGYEVADGFVVLSGSESPKNDARSTSPAIVALRKKLLAQGVLADAGGYLSLMEDYKFMSLSDAAGAMLARPANGRIEWTDGNGRPHRAAKSMSTVH